MNYKKSISAICLTLIICITLGLIAACTPSSTPNSSSVDSLESTSSDDITEENESSEEELEAYDMQGREFKILQR